MVRRTKNQNIRQHRTKNNIFRFSAISLLVIFTFFTLPTINDFLDKNLNFKKSVISNAGVNFDQELEKRKKILDGEKETKTNKLNLKNIFADIDYFSTDDEGQNSIRFDARTIEQLFKDTNYNLERVRETKLVNIGNKIDHLPKEIKSIESSKKRKRLFIQIVLPLIVEENAKIRLDRKELFRILGKNINTQKEKNWLKEKFKQYGLRDGDFYSLKVRMDEVPVSLALAQAAKETGWGTSRFAQEGNALFGQWTWNGEGIRPAGVDKDAKHKVAKFAVLKASVRAYQRNLNTHSSYCLLYTSPSPRD